MKLYCIPTSPYARKVLAAAVEIGLSHRIERVVTPLDGDGLELHAENPLGKVPTLIADDGTALYDSPVICEYLDSLHGGRKLFPPAGPARWQALRRQAVGDGILDCAVLCRYEGQRPESLRSAAWVDRNKGKIARTLDRLETEANAGGLAEPVTIGHIAVACALAYLDLRFTADGWRQGHPALAGWFVDFAARRCMAETAFPPG